ncbi:hypothetical protein PY365_29290 [Roseiarcaceae bacterium H3SJ34-1]|uniref:hypothetical protein n=1 Tax=Terripilifer ovatus TaxID=3032367 RepID=UPI003AB95EDB|nr:hypothetical protein [Roseiarcaceae bacterium H3SJ34-1]
MIKTSPIKSRHTFPLALLAGCLAASPVFAQPAPPAWQGVYGGTIGKARVVVALTPLSARYFYAGKANDLGLIIPENGDLSKLQETLTPDISEDDLKTKPKLATGTWSLSFDKDTLNGTWKDPSGKTDQPIALKRLSKGDEGANSVTMTLDNPGVYAAHWLSAAPALVSGGKEMTIGPLTLKTMRDPSFGGEVPRLVKAPEGVRIAAVNAGLERLQRYLRIQDRDCAQGLRGFRARTSDEPVSAIDKKGDDEDNAAVLKATYATDRLLTLEESHMTFCGGAHPNISLGNYTFDLSDGALVTGGAGGAGEFDDLGPKGLGRALDLGTASKRAKFDAFWKAAMRAGIAADRKAAKAQEKADPKKAEAKKEDDDGDCSKLLESQLKEKPITIHAYPTARGLAVRVADFPHYAEVCEVSDPINPVVLPYASLKPFLKPEQTLLPVGK